MKKVSKIVLLLIFFIGNLVSYFYFFDMSKAEVVYQKDKDNIRKSRLSQILNESKVDFFEPNIYFSAYDGKKVNLADFRGQKLLIYFWASYCNDCVENLKYIQKLQELLNFRDIKDIKILPISVDYKKKERVKEFLTSREINLPFYIDKSRGLISALGGNEIPATYLISSNGYVVNYISDRLEFDSPVFLEYLQSLDTPKKVVETNEQSHIMTEVTN